MNRQFCCAFGIMTCVLACVCGAHAQETDKDQITWEDISGPDSHKGMPEIPEVIQEPAPVVSQKPGEVFVPEQVPTEIEVKLSAQIPEVKEPSEAPAEVPVEAKPVVEASAEAKPAVEAAPEVKKEASKQKKPKQKAPKPKAPKQKVPAPKVSPKEETALQRATALTDANPGSTRDTFIVNPDRE